MICPTCQANNDDENVFCVNCGISVLPLTRNDSSIPPTQSFPHQAILPTQNNWPNSHSIETHILPTSQSATPPMNNFIQPPGIISPSGGIGVQQPGKSYKAFVLAGIGLMLLLAVGLGTAYFLNKQSISAEALPDHLGMFVLRKDKNKVEEIKKQDFTNALEGKNNLLKDDNLPTTEGNPNLILYADAKEVPLTDLKLVQLDTLKDDGSLRYMNFEGAPIEGKTEMKRIRIPDGLANGKYAFALFEGYLDEGKHKLWAFQVKNAERSNNDDKLMSSTVSIKPKQTVTNQNQTNTQIQNQTNSQTAPPPNTNVPPGATVAYITMNNVFFRSGPSQSSSPLGKFYRGQKVYILGYSSNSEEFYSKTGQYYNSPYAQVMTENGERGWVYGAFVK